jgi:proline dehydrogenase
MELSRRHHHPVPPHHIMMSFRRYFNEDTEHLDAIIGVLDPSQTNDMIDYISFSQMITPYTLSTFTLKCKDVGPLAQVTPSDEEVVLMRRMSERLHILAEEAAICGTKLLIDAEHTKYQPAIDNLVLELKQKYNAKIRTSRPVIFNTYQCYLKDARERILTDLQRSERFGFHFAAKLVRGAYMIHERERARELNRPSPIHDSAFDTHACYDEVIELLLKHRHLNGQGLEIMIATHNKESIQKAVHLMNDLNLGPNDDSVHFAQLYGMSDNLTFTLGKHGYNAYKYLPYGEVQQVIPYLVRRAQENGDVLGKAKSEVVLLREELKERFLLA